MLCHLLSRLLGNFKGKLENLPTPTNSRRPPRTIQITPSAPKHILMFEKLPYELSCLILCFKRRVYLPTSSQAFQAHHRVALHTSTHVLNMSQTPPNDSQEQAKQPVSIRTTHMAYDIIAKAHTHMQTHVHTLLASLMLYRLRETRFLTYCEFTMSD